jgi:hypothetical protein
MLAGAVLFGALPAVSVALDSVQGAKPQTAQSAPVAEPALDPAIHALLVGLAASLLREAAASADPLTTLGDSLERKLAAALRSPELSRLVEGVIGHAVKDAPTELREPLALFAVAILNNLRREMLDGVRPRARN